MKAAAYFAYGPPDVVQVVDLPTPEPGPHEIRIRVRYSTVNRTDTGFRSAEYVISRLFSGILRPKRPVLGSEFAGEVEKVGAAVTRFKVGDLVFGFDDQRFGGHGQFMVLPQDAAICPVPKGWTCAEAAPLAEGAHYALNMIQAARLKPGDSVLVYGATGAIGSAAVQLLRYFQVRVVAVCHTRHLDWVREMRPDVVMDYVSTPLSQAPGPFHAILDAVGKSSFGVCKPLLHPEGVYISSELGQNGENVWRAVLGKILGGRRILFPLPFITQSRLEFIRDRAEDGSFRPRIDRTYLLEDIQEAHRYVESGQKLGCVLLALP